ncbi:unnamed protein product [Plutella xylostella]|uniref:tRNA (uracil-O(2)-)-methyltransferase n=1 Tax=Plutella xylostella TaxID=51655 RepID=A0A8S4EGP3_PLUXY|nr:unnamed protein product [Plutella xylostella]
MSGCKITASSMSDDGFWAAINILINKPHVVNKRLWGCKVICKHTCSPVLNPWLPSVCPRVDSLKVTEAVMECILSKLGLQSTHIMESQPVEVTLIELLPKSYSEPHALQLVCQNRGDSQVYFFDVTPLGISQTLSPDFSFSVQLKEKNIFLKAECDEDSKSFQWLSETVLPQLIKWGEETGGRDPNKQESLSLVSNENYYRKYNELKTKYGKEMVKIWPECTDPSKFVYEDVAIATYLLLLWEDERQIQGKVEKQTFVDLGCGNGLLVYILAMEGHGGVGIDIRKRNIWDIYPSNVVLEEKTVTPSDLNLFPNTDWIIGNHSDELTPWIPVVAARSSYTCNFFLLPCCAYNFDGSKYQRQDSSKSQYTEYLDYIKKLCQECGFRTDTDRLKIPSTKRICLVGRGRTYPEEDHSKYCNSTQKLININPAKSDEKTENWISDFKPREPVERVRNCTKIDKNLILSIVDCIAQYLMKELDTNVRWSPGRSVDLPELVQLIPSDQLKSLKSECGGLQTLLKNHHHIFKVQGGKVQLRHPKSVDEINNEMKSKKSKVQKIQLQQKPCWFFSNHPQGCPLSDKTCSFLHVNKII